MPEPLHTAAIPAGSSTAGAPSDHAVAEVMRRVHEQLRLGTTPSFEALLAFGEPT
jgi:hypothetical protein